MKSYNVWMLQFSAYSRFSLQLLEVYSFGFGLPVTNVFHKTWAKSEKIGTRKKKRKKNSHEIIRKRLNSNIHTNTRNNMNSFCVTFEKCISILMINGFGFGCVKATCFTSCTIDTSFSSVTTCPPKIGRQRRVWRACVCVFVCEFTLY